MWDEGWEEEGATGCRDMGDKGPSSAGLSISEEIETC